MCPKYRSAAWLLTPNLRRRARLTCGGVKKIRLDAFLAEACHALRVGWVQYPNRAGEGFLFCDHARLIATPGILIFMCWSRLIG